MQLASAIVHPYVRLSTMEQQLLLMEHLRLVDAPAE
jgi:hypothetical protein